MMAMLHLHSGVLTRFALSLSPRLFSKVTVDKPGSLHTVAPVNAVDMLLICRCNRKNVLRKGCCY